MEETKQRSKSVIGKIPKFPNGRSDSLPTTRSNTSLTLSPGYSGTTGLNSTLCQGMLTAKIGNQANELM